MYYWITVEAIDGAADHTHDYDSNTVVPPTCTKDGYTKYVCDCGDFYKGNDIEATGHTWGEWIIQSRPTATTPGKMYRQCYECYEEEWEEIATEPFVDVAEDTYYFAPVLWAVENNITTGMSATSFAPEATCTRGQIVTFLWRANGSPEPQMAFNPFSDVSNSDYFYKAVLWAVEKGITSGMGDGTFAPAAPCTRGQVATFLWRAKGKPEVSAANAFTDVAQGAYYYDAVLWAVAKGVTNGMGDGTFAPDAPCTRGQIVTFLYRAMA